ncbi:DUF1906 domain-containing protein [Streptomyces sp. NBC_00433]
MTTVVDLDGVDYSSGRPGGAALAAAGMKFAARYLSHNASKNLNATEAADLAAHGVWCVVVWETTANRAGAGRAAGIADAKDAAAQATACGQPSGRPIFFAVDWDADPGVVIAYFQGVASVIGLARTGVYGGYKVVKALLDHGYAKWAWQTVAWSQGRWDTRAVIRQYASTVRINGVVCDKDTAYATDYGQWMPGKLPTQEDDMTVSNDDALKIARAVATFKNPDLEPKGPDLRQRLVNAEASSGAAASGVKALNTTVAALNATVATLAKAVGNIHDDVDTATLVAAVQQAIADATVHVTVDVTQPTA